MLLKYNAAVPSSITAVPYYKHIFDGEVIKDGQGDGHAYVKLYGQVSLHIHTIGKISRNDSYLIIRFSKDEQHLFDETISRVEKMVDVEVTREAREMIWGTTYFHFKDKYNFNWVLEIDSE